MAEFIEFLSPKALEELKLANAELVTMVANVDKVGQKMKGITTPSGANGANNDLAVQYQKAEKAIDALTKKTEKARLEEIRLQQARERAFDKFEAQSNKEQARLQASQNLYNKVQAKLNQLTNEYKALAVQKELTGNLTIKEAQRYDFLQSKITKYDNTLKAVDATMGKYQRNVGNYASGFSPIANSINQLTREMPAFTYSVQTGFMALSNNIPIFTDAIGNAIQQNKALQAQGKPTTSVLSQLATAFLSWQTLLGVGITLLTVYGKEIGDFLSNTFATAKALDAQAESQKALNNVNIEGSKNAVEEIQKVKSLLAIAKDTTLSYKERTIAAKELQDTYPAYFENLKTEQILAGNTAKAEKELTDAILSRAKAQAAVAKITENQAKVIDVEMQILALKKELSITNNQIIQTEKRLQSAGNVTNSQGIALSQTYDRQKRLISDINKLNAEKSELDKINNTLSSFAIEKEKESILLKYKKEKVDKDSLKTKKEHQTFDENSIKGLENQIKVLQEMKSEVDATSYAYSLLDFQVKLLETTLKSIKGEFNVAELFPKPELPTNIETPVIDTKDVEDADAWLKKYREELAKSEEETQRLKDATDEFVKSFKDAFIADSGLSAVFDILNKRLDDFGDNATAKALLITEAFQQAFNFINQFGQENFDAQRERLRQETEIAIAFAGDSESAKEEIRRQAEQKEKEIRRREFEAKKKQAIFNIAIDTAQAIMASYRNVGFLLGLPQALLMAAVGAAQIAAVNSQEIPAYKDGTNNHKGGLMLVNDGKGTNFKEVIQTPDGKTYQPQERNVFMKAPKGTKVFTHDQWQKNLDSIMMNNNISYSNPKVDFTADFDRVGNKIVSAIQNKTEYSQTIDKNGFKTYVSNGHTVKEILNSQVTFGR